MNNVAEISLPPLLEGSAKLESGQSAELPKQPSRSTTMGLIIIYTLVDYPPHRIDERAVAAEAV